MFYGCSGLSGTLTDNNPTLPSGLKYGIYMFSGCTGLTGNIPALPDSLTDGSDMFSSCSGLSGTLTDNNPTLPSGLKYGDYMFYGCSGLTGQCPTKPDSLTAVTSMYAGTNVTCDYGH